MKLANTLCLLAASAIAVAGCGRDHAMASPGDDCAGIKMAKAENRTAKPIDLYVRGDSGAALLLGYVPADTTIYFQLPDIATGVFTLGGRAPGDSIAPLVLTYRCIRGERQTRPAA